MLWLAVHLPLLPLEACCAALPPGQAERPVVLLRDHAVAQLNAAAAERGLRPGLKRATALALAADLLLAESEPAREAAALQAVAHVALAFTPSVTAHDAQTVLLEVQASLRLFGGLPALVRRLQAALAPLGHRVQLAAAPTARGATLLALGAGARAGIPPAGTPPADTLPALVQGPHVDSLPALRQRLLRAPVWLLGPGRAHWEALQGMGLRTLADLHALPRSGLARRFGPALLDELDQALGERADPRTWIALPAVFEVRLELLARADSTAQVLHAAAVLLARLVAWAQARQSRVAAFTLQLQHERARQQQAAATALRVELAEPSLDAAHLQLLLRERLARLPLPAPTHELRLHCHELVAAPPPNGELFPTRGSEAEGLTRLLERLCARLGEAQVQRLDAVADHRPERASRTRPLAAPAPPGACTPPPWPEGLPLHRPAWLLNPPLPLPGDDEPRLHGQALRLLSGPERIESGWWDGEPVARDYYIAQADDGALVWIYRSRLPPRDAEPDAEPDADPDAGAHPARSARGGAVWHLQGLFA